MTYHFAIPTGGINPLITRVRDLQTEKAGTDAFIGLWLHPMDAKWIAEQSHITAFTEGSEKTEDLHVTLAYIPQITLSQANKLKGIIRAFAQERGPVDAQISGASRFTGGEGPKDAIVLRLESPTLMNLRAALVKAIQDGGIDWEDRFPVYKPHITLRYVPKEAIVPIDWSPDPPVEINLRRLVLRIGNERQEIMLDMAKEGPVEKAGARHTKAEYGKIQKIHDRAVALGAECKGMVRRAGAKHSVADRALIQRLHDNAHALGAECGRGDVLVKRHLGKKHNQKTHSGGKGSGKGAEEAFKELPQNLTNLRKKTSDSIVSKLAKLPEVELTKALRAAEEKGGHEGFVKSGLLRRAMKQRIKELKKQQVTKRSMGLVEAVFLVQRGGPTSGNWAHTGRLGKHGGSKGGGGHKKIGIKGKPESRKQVKAAASSVKGDKESGKPKVQAKPKTPKEQGESKAKVSKPKAGKTQGGGGSANTDPNTWNKRLTNKEEDAILTYTTSKHLSINGGLRKGNLSKEDAATVEQLDSALSKSRLKKETTLYENQKLYRAASIPEVNAALNSGKAVGFEFTEKGYSSTTTNKDIARNFQRDPNSRLFTIKAKPGTKAASVSELSNLSGEDEVLIGRGTKYRVTGVEKVKERIPFRDLKGKVKYRTKTIEYVNLEVVDQL